MDQELSQINSNIEKNQLYLILLIITAGISGLVQIIKHVKKSTCTSKLCNVDVDMSENQVDTVSTVDTGSRRPSVQSPTHPLECIHIDRRHSIM